LLYVKEDSQPKLKNKHFCDQIQTSNHLTVNFVLQLNVESACVVRSDGQTSIECTVCIKD